MRGSLAKIASSIMTQVANEFFLSEDIANFAIKNDNPSSAAKALWVRVERHRAFHLALALGVGQTARGPLMQFYRDMSMPCELVSQIDERTSKGFHFRRFLSLRMADARWPHSQDGCATTAGSQGSTLHYRESFSTAKSDLIMAFRSQFRRSVRRDVEAGTSRQSGATTTPTNHPEK